MVQKVILLDSDERQAREFCGILEKSGHFSQVYASLERLKKCLASEECLGVFIDVDTVPVTNHEIRDLALEFPGLHLFCLSKRRFHPELQDAIYYHVYACLNRPVDPEELRYWLRIISSEGGKKE